jgi:general stress protein YciG
LSQPLLTALVFTEGMITMAESRKRGFAGMDSQKQREIASKGGRAAHAKGTAHHFTPEEARVAGRKGGQAAHAKGTAHEFTSEEARAAGRKGGQRSQARASGNRPMNGTAEGAYATEPGLHQAPPPAPQPAPQLLPAEVGAEM